MVPIYRVSYDAMQNVEGFILLEFTYCLAFLETKI